MKLTFKQYLAEDEIIDLAKYIEEECAPFLRESKRAGFLYRGMKMSAPALTQHAQHPEQKDNTIEYSIRNVRQNRSPKDTPTKIHRALDRWFDSHFQIKARSQTIFTYGGGAADTAEMYGVVHIVFPMGDFHYIWSPEVPDLYGEIESVDILKSGNWQEELETFLSDAEYKTSDLDKAVVDDVEVMVACTKYLAIHSSYARLLRRMLDIK